MEKQKNNKIRRSVAEILAEVPEGMRRYSLTIHNKFGSIYGDRNASYSDIVKFLQKYRENIVLWEVSTICTPRTFTIEFSINCEF